MPSERLTQVVAAAGRLLDEEGPQALTMRRLAEEVGIRAPSLYKHLPGKDELHRLLVVEALHELGASMAKAGKRRRGSLTAVGLGYRAFALARPHRYRLITDAPLPDDEEVRAAEAAARAPLDEVIGLDVDRGRAVWAFAHGMADLELRGRFPTGADVEAAWAHGLAAFEASA